MTRTTELLKELEQDKALMIGNRIYKIKSELKGRLDALKERVIDKTNFITFLRATRYITEAKNEETELASIQEEIKLIENGI